MDLEHRIDEDERMIRKETGGKCQLEWPIAEEKSVATVICIVETCDCSIL